MLHLTDVFFVCPLLSSPLVAFRQWDVLVTLGKRVKHLYIKKKALCFRFHQKQVAWMSTLASLVMIALLNAICSPNNV